MIGLEKAQEVAELLKQGITQIEVARQLGTSQAEVSRRRASLRDQQTDLDT